jgi:arsenate reductase (thioredoxin)
MTPVIKPSQNANTRLIVYSRRFPAFLNCLLFSHGKTTVTNKTLNVLFLCTGNSARSILGEALLNHLGRGHFRGFSAGSHPTGKVHPLALKLLAEKGIPIVGLSSKSWDTFADEDSPAMDIVITVCDNAAGEACPIWPGAPLAAHWGFPDPAAGENDDAKRLVFGFVFERLVEHIAQLIKIDFETLSPETTKKALADIHQ